MSEEVTESTEEEEFYEVDKIIDSKIDEVRAMFASFLSKIVTKANIFLDQPPFCIF